MSKRRVFIAINLPESIRKKLSDLRTRWPDLPCRWINPENLHLTIIPPIYLDDDELSRVMVSVSSELSSFPPFTLEFEKLTYGPPSKPGRMIWAMGKPSKELAALKKAASKAILAASVPFMEESRQLVPHITLCRMEEKEWRQYEPKPLIDERLEFDVEVSSAEAMESKLKRGGAEYAILESMPLGQSKE